MPRASARSVRASTCKEESGAVGLAAPLLERRIMQKKYDINLLPDESPDDVVMMLEGRFGVTASYNEEQWNSAATIVVEGTAKQHRMIAQWHNAPHTPRPDLQGRPPVGKGENRS